MNEAKALPDPATPPIRLLRTKLFIPRAHPDIVQRPRLVHKLNEGLLRKLIVVSAPAGSGKSTLLSSWIGERTRDESGRMKEPTSAPLRSPSPSPHPLQFAWLSLDERDNDPVRFWTYWVAALQTIHPEIGRTTLSMFQSPQPPPLETILVDLLNEILGIPKDFALVLDDYHTIESQTVHNGLSFLLENLPGNMHLILAGRTEPPLNFPQLRVRRELVELHAADLRFTPEEAALFLNQVMGLSLTTLDITALDQLTEGWVAGLQLAAMALQASPSSLSMQGARDVPGMIQSFSGSHRYVFDYLAQEVLNRQPEPIRDFLIRTSILERLAGDLCDSLPSSNSRFPTHSQQNLEYLEGANLFIVPLDPQRHWFRYHHLFSDFLRTRLEQEVGRAGVEELHGRASRWFEKEGLVGEAISHALAAKDFTQAARVIRNHAKEMFARSQLLTVLNWLKALPEAQIREDRWLSMIYAWALIATGKTDEVEPHLQAIERSLGICADGSAESLSQPREILTALAEISCIRTSLAFNRMDVDRVVHLSRQALAYLENAAEDGLFNDRTSLCGVASFNLALAHEFRGEVSEASGLLAQTIELSRENPHIKPMAHSHLAQVRLLQGQLKEAERIYRESLLVIENEGYVSPMAGVLYTGLGSILCERNLLEQATDLLMKGIELSRQWNGWEGLLYGYFGLSRVKIASSDMAGAISALQQLSELAVRLQVSWAAPAIEAQRALLNLRRGDAASTLPWLESSLLPGGEIPYQQEADGLVCARIFISLHRLDEAQDLLARLLSSTEQGQRWGRVIEAQVLLALVASFEGEHSSAQEALIRALSLAEPEGYQRIFLDEGEPMLSLLERMEIGDWRLRTYACQLAASPMTKECTSEKLQSPISNLKSQISTSQSPISSLHSLLSERELDVLRLIAAGRSNTEIAGELVISLNTVKTHVKNILSRLEASNRTEAAARARELKLL